MLALKLEEVHGEIQEASAQPSWNGTPLNKDYEEYMHIIELHVTLRMPH